MPILIFPMLTSPNVAANIIPGLCKTMEKHILLYKLDELVHRYMEDIDKGNTRNLRRIRKENIDMYIDNKLDNLLEIDPIEYDIDIIDGDKSEKQIKADDEEFYREKEAKRQRARGQDMAGVDYNKSEGELREKRYEMLLIKRDMANRQKEQEKEYKERIRELELDNLEELGRRRKEQEDRLKLDKQAHEMRMKKAKEEQEKINKQREKEQKENEERAIKAKERYDLFLVAATQQMQQKSKEQDEKNKKILDKYQEEYNDHIKQVKADEESKITSQEKHQNKLDDIQVQFDEKKEYLEKEEYKVEAQRKLDREMSKAHDEKEKLDGKLELEKRRYDLAKDKLQREIEKEKEKKPDLRIGTMENTKTISLEPTWITLPADAGGGMLGIKVVPYIMLSDVSLARALIHDATLSKLQYGIKQKVRAINRFVFRLFYNSWLGKFFFIKRSSITKNIKHDVIFDRTIFTGGKGSRILTCLSKDDFHSPLGIFEQQGGVKKLFNLGWNSILIADDVNKQVTFCPRELKGTCLTLPYAMIYGSISSDVKNIYDDLEDLKKTSAPIFRRRGNIKKLLGEIKMDTTIIDTCDYSNNPFLKEEYLQEDLQSIIAKIIPSKEKFKNVLLNIKQSLEDRDIEKTKKVLNFLPNIKIEKIEAYVSKKDPDFKKLQSFSIKVVENSLSKLPTGMARFVGSMVVVKSMASKKKDRKNVIKQDLKKIINHVRKSVKDEENNHEADTETIMVYSLSIALLGILAYPIFLIASGAQGMMAGAGALVGGIFGIWGILSLIIMFFGAFILLGLYILGGGMNAKK